MKQMTCQQLGGVCDVAFQGESFEEIANQSKAHAMEMFAAGDQAHIEKMNEMRELAAQPGAVEKWMAEKMAEFNNLPKV